uniref:Uncharacterized protein n=1 Tax=Trichogramma kaykai TaxID=54128 RepID=A0ABD2WQY2_9HYME
MDARAPPIIGSTRSTTQEQSYQRKSGAGGGRTTSLDEGVTLPPLPTQPRSSGQRTKFAPVPNWRSTGGSAANSAPPGIVKQQDLQRRRPYKVLGLGATPLMHACQQADRGRVLRLLRDQEETIGYRDRGLRSALHYCMDAGTGGAVAQAAPELVNAPDAEGHTALHLAVIAGDAQLVAVLLAHGADVDAKDLEGHSVLHWATGESLHKYCFSDGPVRPRSLHDMLRAAATTTITSAPLTTHGSAV